MILEDVQTYSAVGVDVGMEHFRLEDDVGGFVRVFLGELDLELEKSPLPWSAFDALDDRLPVEHVVLV